MPEKTGAFIEQLFLDSQDLTVDEKELFLYILPQRIGKFFAVVVLSTTYLGGIICAFLAVWCGITAGTFLAVLTVKFKTQGILLAFFGLFPQYLIYLPVFFLLLNRCDQIYQCIYIQKTGRWGKVLSGKEIFKNAVFLAGMLMALIAGCALESYVNPRIFMAIVKKIAKI